MYEVKLTTSAAKEFRSLSAELKHHISNVIEGLSQEPRPLGTRKLVGHDRLYRFRVWQYRVVYEIDDKIHLVLITRIRHRREVY